MLISISGVVGKILIFKKGFFMSSLTVKNVSLTGLKPIFVAATEEGDTFVNNGRTFLHVKNADTVAERTVTINSLVDCNQGHDHNIEVEIPKEEERIIGPFSPSRFNSNTGVVSVTYDDDHSEVKVAAISL